MARTPDNKKTFLAESTYDKLFREHGTVLSNEESAAIGQRIHASMELFRAESRQKAGQSELDLQEIFINF